MIQQTINQIEAKIRDASSLSEANKAELAKLLATLKAEVTELSRTDAEHARSIAGFADVSAHEATRSRRKPELLELSVDGLRSSVAGFEESHPRLVEIVNRIATTLSNLGI
jgi:hypothetical protein